MPSGTTAENLGGLGPHGCVFGLEVQQDVERVLGNGVDFHAGDVAGADIVPEDSLHLLGRRGVNVPDA
jgi:hypothetical protein